MKIAFFSHYFSPEIGAPSARIHDLAQQWIRFGHEIQVVTCFPNHPTGKLYPGYRSGFYIRETMTGIDVHRHWTYITPNKGFLKKMVGHLSYFPSAVALSIPRLPRADIAIGTSPTFFAPMAARVLASKRKIPFVMEVRDLWPAIFVELGVLRNRLLIRALERWELALYRRSDHIVTVTEAFRQDLIRRQVPPEKITSIHNGADIDFWRPTNPDRALRERLGLNGKFLVLYIGAHGISQALGRILDSARELLPRTDIHILFVGEGAEKDQLVKQARETGLSNVTFLDPVDKNGVKAFYALADVCLVPLRNIPLFKSFIPSKMFEILAMGRPVIGSVSGEAADILRESGGAIVVEPENAGAISKAILAVHDNPGKLEGRGRDFVVSRFSREALARKYLNLLETLGQRFAGHAR